MSFTITYPIDFTRFETLNVNAEDYTGTAPSSISVTNISTDKASYSTGNYYYDSKMRRLLMAFRTELTDAIRFKKIEGATVSFDALYSYTAGVTNSEKYTRIRIGGMAAPITKTGPEYISGSVLAGTAAALTELSKTRSTVALKLSASSYITEIFQNGLCMQFDPADNKSTVTSNKEIRSYTVYSELSSPAPVFTVTFSDDNLTYSFKSTSPSAGSKFSPGTKITMACTISQGWTAYKDVSFEKPTVTAGRLKTRMRGSSNTSTFNFTPTTSLTYGFTYGADAFSVGAWEYQYEFTLSSGDVIESGWKAFDIVDVAPNPPTIIKPDHDILDGGSPIEVMWQHSSNSGTAQAQALVQYGLSGNFDNEISVSGAANTAQLPAGLTSGVWSWRVRTYNASGLFSDWSTASFTVVAAPTRPLVSLAVISPRPEIVWETSEQSAYQIELDGEVVRTEFGPANTWKADEHLAPGVTHTIRVRAQNTFALWSEWGSTEIEVTNEGDEIPLLAETSARGVSLSWTDGTSADYFRLYRDGVCIAQLPATATGYLDDAACGSVSYELRACYDQTDFYDYGTAGVNFVPESNRIRLADGDDWLSLELSEAQYKAEKVTKTRNVNLLHMAGRAYQIAQKSEHYTETIQVTCAFRPEESSKRQRLEALCGETVLLQTTRGRRIYGVIDALKISDTEFYTVYDFSVTRTNYSEDTIHGD